MLLCSVAFDGMATLSAGHSVDVSGYYLEGSPVTLFLVGQ
jgi:hypothetical protein